MHTSRLPFFGVVRVSGDDHAPFLHGQLSNHIEALAPQQAGYATYNTPKGRVLANMLVINRGDDLLLVMAQDLIEATIKRLRMFVLRAKVVFETLPDYAVAGEWTDTLHATPAHEPQHSFPAPIRNQIIHVQLPHGGNLLIGEAAQLPTYQADAEQAWQQHEIQSGYPWITAATSEAAVAQMLNQHTIGGVHFKKGCYPGQEIIARAQYRGQVKRGLAILHSSVPASAGSLLYADEEEVGIIINSSITATGSLHLAVIKHSAADTALHDAQGNPFSLQQTLF